MDHDLETEVELLLLSDPSSSSQTEHYARNPEFNLGSISPGKSLGDEINFLDKEISASFDNQQQPKSSPLSTVPVDDITAFCSAESEGIFGLETPQPQPVEPKRPQNGPAASKLEDIEIIHAKANNAMCWNVEYYQPYFFVDTDNVIHRLRIALLPWRWWNLVFVEDILGNTPDLYGPFWLSTTTAFCVAATYSVGVGISETLGIDILQKALVTFYTMNLVVPTSVWVFLKFSPLSKPLVPLLSTFGYAQVVYLPASLFGIFPTTGAMQLIVLLPAAVASSLCFIRGIMTPDLKDVMLTTSIQIGLSIVALVTLAELVMVLYIALALH